MSFCINCGKELIEGARFCTACGTPVKIQAPEKQAMTAEQTVPVYQAEAAEQTVPEKKSVPVQKSAQNKNPAPVQPPIPNPGPALDPKEYAKQQKELLKQHEQYAKQKALEQKLLAKQQKKEQKLGTAAAGMNAGTQGQDTGTGISGINKTGTENKIKMPSPPQGGSNKTIIIIIIVAVIAILAALIFKLVSGNSKSEEKSQEAAAAEMTEFVETAEEEVVTEEAASDEPLESLPVYTISYDAGEGGKVQLGEDIASGAAQEVTSAAEIEEVTAVPDDGYKFVNWTDADGNVVSEETKFTADAAEATEYTANFEKAVFDDWHDDVLKECAAKALGKDSSEITVEDLDGVTKLYIIGEGATTDDTVIQQLHSDCESGTAGSISITDLEDIRNFTNLETLYLQYCNLDSDILASLELPDTVTLLNLDNNNLTNLDGLAGCKGLDVVSARSNNITDYSGIENLGLSNWDFTNNPVGY